MNAEQKLEMRWGAISNPLDLSPRWSPSDQDHTPPSSLTLFAMLTEVQVTQIIMNLVMNARDALQGEEGLVIVEVSSTQREITLSVSDDGAGMSDDLQYRIFDPFFTTKPEGEGTGLGLHVIKQIVHRVGGELSLRSEEGQGSVFTISLPHAHT